MSFPRPDIAPARPSPSRRLPASLRAAGVALALALGLAPALVRAQASAPAAPPAPPAPVVGATTDRLDQITARGVLRVGTTGDYKPFSHRVAGSDRVIGLDIDLAADLARSLGVRLQLVPTTWGTLMPDLLADRFDLAIGGVSVTLDRQRRAFYSTAYLRDGKTPIARCADVSRFQTVEQINQPGVRLIVNPGGTNERFARAHAPRASLKVWLDNVTIFDRLVAGDADVMITDAIEARLQARLHPQLCAIHPEAPFDFSEKAVLLPRDLVLKAYVDQWLHQLVEGGQFRRLHEQWLAYPWGLETLRQVVEARLLLAPDVARWKWNHHADIEDVARERQVVDAVATQAAALGVPRRFAEAVVRAQIEASKTVQRELFMGWEVLKTGTLSDVPDLQAVTRPKIDAATAQLVHALATSWPLLADPQRHADVLRALKPVETETLSLKAVEQAMAPLLEAHRWVPAAQADAPASAASASGAASASSPAAGPAAGRLRSLAESAPALPALPVLASAAPASAPRH